MSLRNYIILQNIYEENKLIPKVPSNPSKGSAFVSLSAKRKAKEIADKMLLTAFDICKKYTGAVDEELMPYIKGTSGISQESEESPCNMIVLIELELQGEESVECFIKEWKDLAKNQKHLCLMKFRKTKSKNDKDVIKLQGKATLNFGS